MPSARDNQCDLCSAHADTGVSRVICISKKKKKQNPKPDTFSQNQVFCLGNLGPRSPPGAHLGGGGLQGGERARKLPTENTLGSPARYLGYPHFFSGNPRKNPAVPTTSERAKQGGKKHFFQQNSPASLQDARTPRSNAGGAHTFGNVCWTSAAATPFFSFWGKISRVFCAVHFWVDGNWPPKKTKKSLDTF